MLFFTEIKHVVSKLNKWLKWMKSRGKGKYKKPLRILLQANPWCRTPLKIPLPAWIKSGKKKKEKKKNQRVTKLFKLKFHIRPKQNLKDDGKDLRLSDQWDQLSSHLLLHLTLLQLSILNQKASTARWPKVRAFKSFIIHKFLKVSISREFSFGKSWEPSHGKVLPCRDQESKSPYGGSVQPMQLQGGVRGSRLLGGKHMIFNFLLWIFPQIQICSQISIYINKILAQ